MTDNRELDILVAKTLGYELEREFDGFVSGGEFRIVKKSDNWVMYNKIPNYSTDIAEAMKLVEREKEFGFVLGIDPPEEYPEGSAHFDAHFGFAADASDAIAETASLAIVRAWLAWKGVDHD